MTKQSRVIVYGFVLTFLTLSAFPRPAQSFELAGVGAFNLTFPSTSATTNFGSYSTQLAVGFGALMAFSVSKVFNLEVGALYVPRTFNEGALTKTFTQVEAPVLLRFTPLPIVSLAAGGYFAYGLGNYTINAIGSTTGQTADYALTGYSRTDFGLLASVALSLPIIPQLNLLADLRYYFGLANIYTTAALGTFNFRDFQLLVGLKVTL